ncbi:MAG: PEP-CTERM sorting domain-containing protein [Anaerohalosphaera sp.]|nr:PEP-CTERM sorting domain-containing protein [Anaerohalosphaera sp.]
MKRMLLLMSIVGLGLSQAVMAGVVVDVDFDAYAYDSIADLQTAGWVFGGETTTNGQAEESIIWQNGEKVLKLDPGTDGDVLPEGSSKPTASLNWGQAVSLGSADFRWSHAASYSTSELRFLDASGVTIFSVGLTDDTKIQFYNGGTKVAHTIADNTAAPTSVHLEWDAGAGTFSYDVNGGAFTGTLGFLNAGTPEAIKYILNKDDNSSREVYLYGITVNEIPEPATMLLLGIGSLGLLRKRK